MSTSVLPGISTVTATATWLPVADAGETLWVWLWQEEGFRDWAAVNRIFGEKDFVEAEAAAACKVAILKKRTEKETATASRNNNNNNNNNNSNSNNSNMADITITMTCSTHCGTGGRRKWRCATPACAWRSGAAEQLAEAAVVPKWSEAELGDTNAMGVNVVMAETVAVVAKWPEVEPSDTNAMGVNIVVQYQATLGGASNKTDKKAKKEAKKERRKKKKEETGRRTRKRRRRRRGRICGWRSFI
ncbi:hypothetical protein PG989_000596 [Apiospora arundinis]